jgi:very-short-patch-repair endonuclease
LACAPAQQGPIRVANREATTAGRIGRCAIEAERLLVKLLRDNDMTGWKTNHPVGGYKVDVAFPKQKVAIETDGWAFHTNQEDFQNDRERQNKIMLLGWQVLRFTWLDLTEYPQRVLAVIRSATSA